MGGQRSAIGNICDSQIYNYRYSEFGFTTDINMHHAKGMNAEVLYFETATLLGELAGLTIWLEHIFFYFQTMSDVLRLQHKNRSTYIGRPVHPIVR